MSMLDGLTAVITGGVMKTQYQHVGEKISKFAQSLCTFYKVGSKKVGKNGKVGNQEVTCIFVGY